MVNEREKKIPNVNMFYRFILCNICVLHVYVDLFCLNIKLEKCICFCVIYSQLNIAQVLNVHELLGSVILS